MVKSMTAYGRSLRQSNVGKWLVEVHSVNKKFLDCNVLMPKELFQFEVDVRKWVSNRFKRGQVTVKISFVPCDAGCLLSKKTEQIAALKGAMEKACDQLGFQRDEISFPFVYQEVKALPSIGIDSLDGAKEELEAVVLEALSTCQEMREKEGLALAEAQREHLGLIAGFLAEVEKTAGGAEERYRQKILEKLQEFKEVSEVDQDRVLREVFFYTEKADITEEITRMKSHLQQFHELLKPKTEGVGRTMDFLLQEMGREVNTMGSKSDHLDVSYGSLKMKGEIEKLKEQAQNIE